MKLSLRKAHRTPPPSSSSSSPPTAAATPSRWRRGCCNNKASAVVVVGLCTACALLWSAHNVAQTIIRRGVLFIELEQQQQPFLTVNDGVAESLRSILELPPPSAAGDNNNNNNNSNSKNGIAIFYNIYTPNRFDNATSAQQQQQQLRAHADRTAAVIEEQLDQITRSHAFRQQQRQRRPLTIHYTTIGLDPSSVLHQHETATTTNTTTTTEPDQHDTPHSYYAYLFRRRNLTAHHLAHFEAGYEEVTLQYLWEYCRRRESSSHRDDDDDDDATVVYMHSKGSYHDDKMNRNWRRHLLSAVTSDLCLEWRNNGDSSSEPQCNVCGLQFYPVWTHFFPGNFFAARCSYVRRLLPPERFAARLSEVAARLLRREEPHRFRTTLYLPDGWTWGEGRYAAEFWVGSHPALVPCDVAETAAVKVLMRPAAAAPPHFSYAVTPRFALTEQRHMLRRARLLALNATMRDREYCLLAGHLVRWRVLYGAAPDARSWVWDYYAEDGKLWKELLLVGNNSATATAAALQKAAREGHDEEWLRHLLSTHMLTTAL